MLISDTERSPALRKGRAVSFPLFHRIRSVHRKQKENTEMTGGRICMKAASASKEKGSSRKKTRNSRTIWNYHIMILIGMVWLFFFNIVPMFGIVIAFEDYSSDVRTVAFRLCRNGKFYIFYFPWVTVNESFLIRWLSQLPNLILNIIVPLAFALLLNEIRQVKFKKSSTDNCLSAALSFLGYSGKCSAGNVRL